MALSVAMVSLGCPKNQVDAELLLADLKNEGFTITVHPDQADAVIINTCGFIQDAKQESIDNILEYCDLKKEKKIRCIVVTGCLAERYRDEIRGEIPEVDVVLGLGANKSLADSIRQAIGSDAPLCRYGEKTDLPLEGERMLSTGPVYAYLKIAEGCDNCCSYCAIPSIRGRYRSRPIESVVREAKQLAAQGIKELVLVAQDTTRYGEDLYGSYRLAELLRQLCAIEPLRWIRVLYCYPERITDELIEVMAQNEKIVRYLDIPIQHANDRVLRAMNRHSTRAELDTLLAKLRRSLPGIVLRTTLIAGFPGETEQEFEELADFVKQAKFERLGCFAYCAEEGTPAATLPDQLDEQTKQDRCDRLMERQYEIANAFNQAQVGKTFTVTVEGFDRLGGCYYGRSYMDAPEIDGKIFFQADCNPGEGAFVRVVIEEVLDYDLIGVLANEQ